MTARQNFKKNLSGHIIASWDRRSNPITTLRNNLFLKTLKISLWPYSSIRDWRLESNYYSMEHLVSITYFWRPNPVPKQIQSGWRWYRALQRCFRRHSGIPILQLQTLGIRPRAVDRLTTRSGAWNKLPARTFGKIFLNLNASTLAVSDLEPWTSWFQIIEFWRKRGTDAKAQCVSSPSPSVTHL